MKSKIQEDIKGAMRAKDELKLSVLRMLMSTIKNWELEKRAKTGKEEELSEDEVMAAIRSEVKKRRDSIVEFEKGWRKDLVEKESTELKILEAYLPAEMPDEEIEKIVKEVIAETGASDLKMFGRIMGEAMKKIKKQASGDRVSTVVRKAISQ